MNEKPLARTQRILGVSHILDSRQSRFASSGTIVCTLPFISRQVGCSRFDLDLQGDIDQEEENVKPKLVLLKIQLILCLAGYRW